jgi:hypothetical protein
MRKTVWCPAVTRGFTIDDKGLATAPFGPQPAEVHGGVGLRVQETSFHLDEGPEMLWVNPYRLLAKGRLLGYARTTPTTTFTVDDGDAVARWDRFDDHAATLEVRTHVVDDTTIDTTFTVTPDEPLEDYEILVSSYYSPLHRPTFASRAVWLVEEERPSWFAKEQRLFEPTTWTRDGDGGRTLLDGRYDVGHPPLWWTIGSWYSAPLMVQQHTIVPHATITMARPADCFAVGGLLGYHNSQYFHLFGETLAAGETRSATIRLIVVRGPVDDIHTKAEEAYRAFI